MRWLISGHTRGVFEEWLHPAAGRANNNLYTYPTKISTLFISTANKNKTVVNQFSKDYLVVAKNASGRNMQVPVYRFTGKQAGTHVHEDVNVLDGGSIFFAEPVDAGIIVRMEGRAPDDLRCRRAMEIRTACRACQSGRSDPSRR